MIDNLTFEPKAKLDKSSSAPLHLQLSEKIVKQISRQKPKAGTRLLSERKLADLLGLDRSTVHRAYIELIRSGIVEECPPSRGLFISAEARNKLRQPFPNIGIILPARFSDFMDEKVEYRLRYMKGIIDRAAELEYSTMMVNLPAVDSSEEYIAEWKKHVIDRLAGIIHLGDRHEKIDKPLKMVLNDKNIPQVFISGYPEYSHIGSISTDFMPGALALSELLIEHGHKRVGLLLEKQYTHPKALYEYEASRRPKIMREALCTCRVDVPEEWIIENGTCEISLKERLRHLLKTDEAPTALCCMNDIVANNAIKILYEMGLKVPEDVSVSGVDSIPGTDDVMPLTSIRLPFYSIGSSALDALHEYVENGISDLNREKAQPASLSIKSSVANAKN